MDDISRKLSPKIDIYFVNCRGTAICLQIRKEGRKLFFRKKKKKK